MAVALKIFISARVGKANMRLGGLSLFLKIVNQQPSKHILALPTQGHKCIFPELQLFEVVNFDLGHAVVPLFQQMQEAQCNPIHYVHIRSPPDILLRSRQFITIQINYFVSRNVDHIYAFVSTVVRFLQHGKLVNMIVERMVIYDGRTIMEEEKALCGNSRIVL